MAFSSGFAPKTELKQLKSDRRQREMGEERGFCTPKVAITTPWASSSSPPFSRPVSFLYYLKRSTDG